MALFFPQHRQKWIKIIISFYFIILILFLYIKKLKDGIRYFIRKYLLIENDAVIETINHIPH